MSVVARSARNTRFGRLGCGSSVLIPMLLSVFVAALPEARAEDSQKHAGGLSQLNFDSTHAEPPARVPSKDDITEILGDDVPGSEKAPQAAKSTATKAPPPASGGAKEHVSRESSAKHSDASTVKPDPVAAQKPSAGVTAAELVTPKATSTGPVKSFDWVRPEDPGAQFLVPLLRPGPATDAGQVGTITTGQSWKRENATCQDAPSRDALCGKARALKELFQRFSGSDDFYVQQCIQACPNAGDQPYLTGFAVKAVRDGEFQMVDEKKICRYRIRVRGETPRWQVLEGERGVCSCLPPACVK